MRKEVIDIDVRGLDEATQDVEQLNDSLQDLDRNLDKVDESGRKAGEGVEEVTKNGGAIAILDQLTGGLATRFRDAFEATKLFNLSLKGTRTALIATGIGAFVVALALVVAYWDDIVELITGANKELAKQIELNQKNLETLDFELKLLETKEKILIAEGKSTKEIKKLKNELLEAQLIENALLLDKLKTQLEIETSQAKELTIFQKLGSRGRGAKIGSVSESEQTELDAITKSIQEATIRTEELRLRILELNAPEGEAAGDAKIKGKRKGVTSLQTELEGVVSLETAKTDIITDGLVMRSARIAQAAEDDFNAQIFWAELTSEQKLSIASTTFKNLSTILGEETAAGKAAAIAATIIDTYQSATASYKSLAGIPVVGPALGAIAAAAAVAAGLANVKAITATPIPGGKDVSGGGAATPTIPQIQAPQFNIVGDTGINQLAASIGQQTQQPIKAFVVSKDVTTQQALDRDTVSTATFGD